MRIKKLVLDDVSVRMDIYKQALLNIAKPGLNHFFMHAASEHAEDGIKIPTGKNHLPGVDKVVRSGDNAVWSSEEMKDFLLENNFELINYGDIHRVQLKWQAMR